MITPAYSLTATERVLPKLALDFTTASLDPRVTFTRSGNTATVVNSSGLVAAINADLPRFDYDPTTLACKGLLIEEARTNICLQSQDMATTWSAIAGTVNAGQAVSPDGTQNADELVAPNGSAATLAQTISTTTTAYGWSVFAKSNGLNTLRLYSRFNPQNDVATFNLATQTATVGAGGTSAIEDYGNGWYRCSAVFTPTLASATNSYRFITEAGDGAKSVYLWGAQLEAGAFATSYIPTVASQVTRTADVATMTGTDFSDWFNASEGSFAIEGSAFAETQGVQKQGFLLVSPTVVSSSFRVSIAPLGYTIVNTTTQVNQSLSTFVANTDYTVVAAYKLNDCQFASNSTLGATDTACTIPTVNFAQFGRFRSTDGLLSGYIKSMRYWPQRLTGAELQAFSN